MIKYIIPILFSVSCSNECNLYPQYDWGFNYDVYPNEVTPDGIEVDTSGQVIDLLLIDKLYNETKDCLSQSYKDDKNFNSIWCPEKFYIRSTLNCIKVKIPNDWSWSCYGEEQLLRDRAPDEGCIAKGFTIEESCPCKWRGGVQGDDTIIVTPNLRMFKEEAAKIITGCWYIYDMPKIVKCL